MEFVGVNIRDNSMLALLSDGVRSGLIKHIDTQEFLVMTRESTLQILKDMGKDASCMEGECEVEVARNIGADFVISGNVTFFEGTYIVTLKLHDTASSALLSTDQIENQKPLELIKQMPILGERLMTGGKLIDKTETVSSVVSKKKKQDQNTKEEYKSPPSNNETSKSKDVIPPEQKEKTESKEELLNSKEVPSTTTFYSQNTPSFTASDYKNGALALWFLMEQQKISLLRTNFFS